MLKEIEKHFNKMWYEMPLSSAHNGATVINFVRGENE
jgi:hypothetical protein